jgi:hypothetical protein
MAGANDCDTRLCDRIYISARVENQRWVIDLPEARGISGIVQTNDGYPGRGCAPQFILRQFHGASSGAGLGGNGPKSDGFQFGQRRSENILEATHVLHQASTTLWTQAFSQGKGQPFQGEAFAGSSSRNRGFGQVTTSASRLTRGLLHPRKKVSRSADTQLC